eukprot:11235440-Alexandrium_andersonii.AAC.2
MLDPAFNNHSKAGQFPIGFAAAFPSIFAGWVIAVLGAMGMPRPVVAFVRKPCTDNAALVMFAGRVAGSFPG